ncbi:MAG TPA: hypothetical protein ENJ00_04525 [Phycisphaerales bacterium]|nr:hypothetical protein [Phycisphaerales bacterium]
MTELVDLWVPILVATVGVFVLSFVFWMLSPHHQADVAFCPEQDAVMEMIRVSAIKPGMYMFPNCATKAEWSSEEYKALYESGPWGMISVLPGKPNMGRNLVVTFVYFLIVSVVVAYLTGLSRAPGAEFLAVFQVASTAAGLVYVLGGWTNGIWFGKRLRFFITDFFDGLLYAGATGIAFALLWPGAAPAI